MMYTAELDEESIKLIIKALDLYSRLQVGQLQELANPFLIKLPNADYGDVMSAIHTLKKSMFPELDEKAFYSFRSKNISNEVRNAADLFVEFNNAVDNSNKKITKWSSTPLTCSVKRVKN